MNPKKNIYWSIITVLLSMFFLTGCLFLKTANNNDNKEHYNVYIDQLPESDYFISDIEMDIFKTETYKNPDASTSKKIMFYGKNIDLDYTSSSNIMQRNYNYDEYVDSTNKNIFYRFKENTNELIRISGTDNTIIGCEEELKKEEDFKIWVESIIGNYIDLSQYEYSCRTLITVHGENSVGNVRYDEFRLPIKENESNARYTFTYTKYVNGYPTTDYVQINTDKLGNVNLIILYQNEFDQTIIPVIQANIVDETIEQNLKSIINKNKYMLESYRILSKRLFLAENGKVEMSVSIEISVKDLELDSIYVDMLSIVVRFD